MLAKPAAGTGELLSSSTAPHRLISLDAMRGFTIAAMLLVNFPGDGEQVYHTLHHTIWNGLSFTDLVAPFFLFIIGVSIVLAYAGRLESGAPKGEMYRKIIIRSLKIFAVGMFLNLQPDFDFSTIRWTGTLHRIAIVFMLCAFIFLNTSWKQQAGLAAILLVGYWLALTRIPTPGVGKVMLEPGVNLVAWFDRLYLPGKMWQGTWDPESILSTIPSVVSGLTGMLAGRLMLTPLNPHVKVNYLMTAGLLSAATGYFWGLIFPVNENLWTSSFVMVTSGFAALVLGATYFSVDLMGYVRGTKPGIIFGANAIAVYVTGDLLGVIFYRLPVGGLALNQQFQLTMTTAGLEPKFVSMLYALLFVCLNFIPAWWLYKKKIFVKL
ncbi:acyltransferase family protein [Arsenicibacter rosenii]|uniref:Heparan-alpha-glucosaminide N-acetyltransferase n=1 Tax=Arsenicibacter rosenii TaxID=1750698 RepID=A0A1S2VSH7_9BACT|nr:heparan-alpha-glucosaminide N-acetyltransferase domain-containing protein [Arsenicibacter rosenii]OIN61236.1 heparan-alpha-glucosaminide N-acetyltransferase [Arsenicibacter rosenii]